MQARSSGLSLKKVLSLGEERVETSCKGFWAMGPGELCRVDALWLGACQTDPALSVRRWWLLW